MNKITLTAFVDEMEKIAQEKSLQETIRPNMMGDIIQTYIGKQSPYSKLPLNVSHPTRIVTKPLTSWRYAPWVSKYKAKVKAITERGK